MAKLKTGPKVILIVLVVVGAVFGIKKAAETGLIPTPGVMKALVPQKVALPDVKDTQSAPVAAVALPGSKPAQIKNTLVRGAIWEWNAQMGLLFANGGSQTAENSLMAKHNVNLMIYRQDDTGQMQQELISCAKELKEGANQCSTGANFVVIMGDGSGQFIAAVNPQLAKLGPEWKLKVIGSVGYSRGEDAFLAPAEVKQDPQKAKGLLVSGVLRDGDWNIAMKWMADNAIPNNPDEKTYDPEAVNWVNASDYNVAAQDYVAGKCEDRKVVKAGHLTGETKKVCINGTVTWTPGDVTVVKQRGGLVKIASSKEYRSQMPAVIVGPGAFFQKNREEIQGLLAAVFEGGDQVKSNEAALKKAGEISAQVYKDQDGAYWTKYYKGVSEVDATGTKVPLGGSSANNLADNLQLFGLVPGANDNFRSTYTLFAGIVMQQYPELFKETPIPDVKEVEDKSFITGAQAVMDSAGAEAEKPVFAAVTDEKMANMAVVSKRSYEITFMTGSADLTPEGAQQLLKLKDSIAITGLFVKVDGYTDNQGSDTVNIPLSEARAKAVKTFLQQKAPDNFPDTRFAVAGHGSQKPLADNKTAAGRAKNRRVEIALLGE